MEYGGTFLVSINGPHTLPHDFSTHNHEEADTQIPLLLLHPLSLSKYKHVDVYSPDTYVLVLLMDLASRENAGGHRLMKSQAMVGLHTLTGEEHGNK